MTATEYLVSWKHPTKTLIDAGITHAFVNWGSDHPALLADLERQRLASDTGKTTQPEIITCPNEMVALSAAQGYAQATGKPALVIIHVDVGTQALAGAVHNVDRCRVPVIIYAGASPFSAEGEHRGTRNEWIMWLQDVVDQPQIVRQYMRYTTQLYSAKTIPGYVRRAMQIATSEPKGPVYLWARREAMEEIVEPKAFHELVTANAKQNWPCVEPSALSPKLVSRIVEALSTAKAPLIITSHIGRNVKSVKLLQDLSTLFAIPILPVCPSTVCVSHSHPYGLAPTYLNAPPPSVNPTSGAAPAPQSIDFVSRADVILIIDSDLSWVPGNGQRPPQDARIFVMDGGDPLKVKIQMGWWRGEAEAVSLVDSETALEQILDLVKPREHELSRNEEVIKRSESLRKEWERRVQEQDRLELEYKAHLSPGSVTYTVPNILGVLREGIKELTPSKGGRALILNETITNFQPTWEHMRPEVPGSMLTSGGSSLGWALGAAVGAALGDSTVSPMEKHDFIVAIVGDGCYMFGIPSTSYWMARRYETPFLTIVLNNGGWRAPKFSMLGVHPTLPGSATHDEIHLAGVPADRLSTGFGPICPDYSQIAVAASAGWVWGAKAGGRGENEPVGEKKVEDGGKALLEETIRKGIEVVVKENGVQ
ncbi:acetolactate synthase catalytic subunit [Coprinopsis sp. MPI-PUGE-AT-0042]|nr:acetolactate synthase catalytic subunit [Coprinopsis sp. MPI-PUGE-AT-0042]